MSVEATMTRGTGVAPLGKIAIFAMVASAAVLLGAGLLIAGEVDPFALVPAAILLVLSAGVARGWRWVPAVAGVLSGLLLLVAISFMSPALASPQDPDFILAVLMIALPMLALVAGIGASVQNYRGGERRLPAWFRFALTVGAGLVAGVIALSLIIEKPTEVRVSPEVLEDLPAVGTRDFNFNRTQIRVKAGEMVALRLDNHDTSGHSFDIDELNVHVPMYRDQTGLALFRPEEPGTYRFYCGIPGHADLEKGTGMVGTLIVEP